MTETVRTTGPDQTVDAGAALAEELHGGDLVLLHGPIGAGKSTLASGIGRGLGVRRWRGSPSFALVNEYSTIPALIHADLYRLSARDMDGLGLEEYARSDSILVVEWPERAYQYLLALTTSRVIEIDLEILDEDTRLLHSAQRTSAEASGVSTVS